MFTNPHVSAQLAHGYQRELLANAGQHRLAAEFRGRSRTAHPLTRIGRGLLEAARGIFTRRTVMPA